MVQYVPGQDQADSYVLACTSTYVLVHVLSGARQYTRAYWYVLVRTLDKICVFLIHPGGALSANYDSVVECTAPMQEL